MNKLSSWKTIFLMCIFCVATAIASPAQNEQVSTNSVTFSSLASFSGTDGANPGVLVQGADGDFYGVTLLGGISSCGSCGTVFKMTPGGALTTLHSFDGTDGGAPLGLALATNGNFYGTTASGGANGPCGGDGCGTVFRVTPGETLSTLYSFCAQTNCTDGDSPQVGVIQASDGNFYGTAYGGGANQGGTVFKITAEGNLTTLYSFCARLNPPPYGGCADGSEPYAVLVQGTNGNFYGTTEWGGVVYNKGTIFEITPGGTLTTLHSFDGTDGCLPQAGMVQATNGNLYGTTSQCGANNVGTVFEITPGGKLTTLYNFCSQPSCTDGTFPTMAGALVQATDGNFYGTTEGGGLNYENCFGGCGTIFKITPAGTLTTLYSFCPPAACGGVSPFAGLVQDTNGKFYGTTAGGGAYSDGTVFELSVGLGPFVKTLPTSGKVDTPVKIFGNNLTGTTSVTFDGTPLSAFMLVSSTEITTFVPSSATTGYWTVTTPRGTLRSNVKFQVRP